MSDRAAIPVDAVVAKALERRTVYPAGSLVYVRNSLNEAIELNEVLAVVMVTSHSLGLHYVVAAPIGMPSATVPRVIARRVVAAQYVADTPDACVAQSRPPTNDSVDDHIYALVQVHRRKFAEQQARRRKE